MATLRSPSLRHQKRSFGLHHSDDTRPGITRKSTRQGFVYISLKGKPIHSPTILKRIHALAIPPAYTDIWICPSSRGHLQATGIDARGRKQYRYHPKWNEVRDATKYERMIAFGHDLPHLRRTIHNHLALPHLSQDKVCATIVALLDKTHIRIGNEAYAKENHSFGLTTLRNRHVTVKGSETTFRFRGKSGIAHASTLHDKRLTKIIRACQELPGGELFSYIDVNGKAHDITSTHVNEYIQNITGTNYSAKDFRTWHGTVLATTLLIKQEPAATLTEAKKRLVSAVKEVAKSLGNTPAVCRKCYIHPAVLEAYLELENPPSLRALSSPINHSITGISAAEQRTLAFLEHL